MNNKVLITICGRAGSQGFKNKNLKTLLGYPLVYYTLSAANIFIYQTSDVAHVDVCLNTDSDALIEIVDSHYPEVHKIKRESGLSGGDVPKPAVWLNCLDIMQNKLNIKYDYLIDLDITSPLRQVNDVFNAYNLKLDRPDADLVESMCLSRRNPYFNMMKEDGKYVTTVIDCSYTARQQAPVVYDENASIYVMQVGYFEKYGYKMSNARTIPYLMKDTAVLDIDSEEDFHMMEIIGQYLFENEQGFKLVRDNIRK